jgi:soluble lytic murein transglycosylase-like protein
MERFWLAVLIGCAVIGASLTDPEAENPSNLAQGSAHFLSEPPSVSAGPPDAAVAGPSLAVEPRDQEIVAQILQRFAVRHTALPERERRRLAHAIVIEARALRLEPDLVMAVIEVESAGYHLAQSHVGALGLMQLLPSTGEELAGKLGIEWMGPDTLFDPIINIRLGTAYLRQLADRYDGNVEIALAAYNWGPGRIDRRLRRGATVPSLYIEQVKRAVNRYADIGTTRS